MRKLKFTTITHFKTVNKFKKNISQKKYQITIRQNHERLPNGLIKHKNLTNYNNKKNVHHLKHDNCQQNNDVNQSFENPIDIKTIFTNV